MILNRFFPIFGALVEFGVAGPKGAFEECL